MQTPTYFGKKKHRKDKPENSKFILQGMGRWEQNELMGKYTFFGSIHFLKAHQNSTYSKHKTREIPGGPVVKNLTYNAGDVGLITGQETKIPHVVGQLSPRATTTELTCLNQSPCAANYRVHALWDPHTTTTGPTCRGACMPQLEKRKNPHATREKPAHHNEEPVHCNDDPACGN